MTLKPAPINPPPTDPAVLREVARIVAEASGAERVILFGSVARGEARPESDLDLLLVMPDELFGPRPSLFELTEGSGRAIKALWRQGYRFDSDLVPMRRSHYEEGASVLARAVAREGVVLYDHSSRGGRDG